MTVLKQLEITGFKSFANPTTFVFDSGITAIIGPNGSGKSNVSEALRWVLGEQQYTNLRGRRTEDVIFAGSDRRGQMGMAEVTLTLDNCDGGLPIEFGEVQITRRAHRSGESQYLINGSRVRLKDIQQLAAPLGQAHTIIGQGLVDAVLSQRPEDRRGLFEHAAGTTGLRIQATTAERSLNEAEENARRLRDILSELEPRVRSLARAARQAREYGAVRDELQDLQRRYYGSLWQESTARQRDAHASLRGADAALTAVEEEHSRTSGELARLRGRERELGTAATEVAERLAAVEREFADARHRLDLIDAEARAAAQRIDDLTRTRTELDVQRESREDDLERIDTELEALRETCWQLEAQREERATAAETVRRQRRELEEQVAHHDRALIDISRRLAESEGRTASLEERLAGFDQERAQIARQLAETETSTAELQEQCRSAAERRDERRTSVESCAHRLQERETALLSLRQQVEQRRGEIEDKRRELDRQQSRLDVLDRTYEQGEGLYAGVRFLLRSVRTGKLDLPGLIGPVADLVTVPKQYETAIEIALGGHLQDIVVRAWRDAEQAIAVLKKSNAGRATFQPLDTIRSMARRPADVEDPGLLGIAADLVTVAPEIEPVLWQLLGRTLIAEDLAATRRIVKTSRGWTVVTLAGEIARPSGSVTGGSHGRTSGLLGRERERRGLPADIHAIERAIAELTAQLERDREGFSQASGKIEDDRAELERARSSVREVEGEIDTLERDLASASNRAERLSEAQQSLTERRAEAERTLEETRQSRETLLTEREQFREQRAEAERRLASEPPPTDETLAGIVIEVAAARERLRSLEREQAGTRQHVEQATKAITGRSEEIDRLVGTQAELRERRVTAAREINRLQEQLSEVREAVDPLAHERELVAHRISAAEEAADTSIGKVRDAERERDRAALDLARAQDEAAFLTERIRNDLDLDDPDNLIPEAGETDHKVEATIKRLRDRLRRMSSVSDEVVEEHEQESERLEYLSSQLADVEQAAVSLSTVLADLRRKMATRFEETFKDVAVEFERIFTRLFGGGTARLSLDSDPEQPGGVDIVARPPGKRLQGLNQLSGGERALTAVALLFAIQRVNPSPFCLLDEVDAALDEANVVRFRDELQDLTAATQYIVITHNRGTIEGADTLYGITMGEDSVSRVVSLRLDEAIHAVEEDEAFQSVI